MSLKNLILTNKVKELAPIVGVQKKVKIKEKYIADPRRAAEYTFWRKNKPHKIIIKKGLYACNEILTNLIVHELVHAKQSEEYNYDQIASFVQIIDIGDKPWEENKLEYDAWTKAQYICATSLGLDKTLQEWADLLEEALLRS